MLRRIDTKAVSATMNGDTEHLLSAGKKLRKMLSDASKTVIAPGVYDGITARLAIASGAECLYMVCGVISILFLSNT